MDSPQFSRLKQLSPLNRQVFTLLSQGYSQAEAARLICRTRARVNQIHTELVRRRVLDVRTLPKCRNL